MFKHACVCSLYNDNKCNINKKSIMIRAIINGIVSIVKLLIVLYAVFYAVEIGLLERIINIF